MKIGYEFGSYDAKDPDLEKSQIEEFESEERIFDYLYNKQKRAVLLFLYSPGHNLTTHFNREFEISSAKYRNLPDA